MPPVTRPVPTTSHSSTDVKESSNTKLHDGNGFRAIVKSNEPGTDASQDPADVIREPLPGAVIVPAPTTIIKKIPIGSLGYGLGPIGSLGYGLGAPGLRLGLLGRGLGLGVRGLW
ncbi:Uncharacterised protein r2_g3905 [Pycnogonum litorale]